MKYTLSLIALLAFNSAAQAHIRYTPKPIAECSDVNGNVVVIQKLFTSSARTTNATVEIVPKNSAYFFQIFNVGAKGEVHLNSVQLEDTHESAVGSRQAGALIFQDKTTYVTNEYSGEMKISGDGSAISGVDVHLDLEKSSAGFSGPASVDLSYDRCLPVR